MTPGHYQATGGARLSPEAKAKLHTICTEHGRTGAAKLLRSTYGTISDALTGARMMPSTIRRLEAAIADYEPARPPP